MRTNPLVLIGVMLATFVGLHILGRGSGNAEHVAERAAVAPGGSPLDETLSARQRAAFQRATSSLSLVMFADALPAARGKQLVRSACADLDRSSALLRALNDTCRPTLRLNDAARAMRRACPGGLGCAAGLRRRAATMRALAEADRAYAKVVRREVPEGECREALAPIHNVVDAEFALARADGRMANAIEQADRTAFDEARRTARKLADTIDDDLVWYRTRDMAEACNLEPWAFESVA